MAHQACTSAGRWRVQPCILTSLNRLLIVRRTENISEVSTCTITTLNRHMHQPIHNSHQYGERNIWPVTPVVVHTKDFLPPQCVNAAHRSFRVVILTCKSEVRALLSGHGDAIGEGNGSPDPICFLTYNFILKYTSVTVEAQLRRRVTMVSWTSPSHSTFRRLSIPTYLNTLTKGDWQTE